MPRVAIYTRLSSDPTGEQTATARQRAACLAFADIRGWEVVHVYEDVDLSAYKRGVVRPDYEALLEAVAARQLDGVLVWKLDRLMRRSSEFERFWAACEHRQVFLASATEPIDTTNEFGLAIVRILVTFAGLEAATIGARMAAKHRERAYAGKPHHRVRAYGLSKDWTRLNFDEAILVREAARRVIGGESVNSIARDWRARHIPSAKGTAWHAEVIRAILLSPRIVGDRAYHGQVVARDCFPAVLDRVTWAKATDAFSDASRRNRPSRPFGLLRGLLVCGRCGTTLTVVKCWKRKTRAYICPDPPTGCIRISVSTPLIDAYVTEAVRRQIAKRGPAPPAQELSEAETIDAHEDHASGMRALCHAFYVEGRITRQEFNAAKGGLNDALVDRVGPGEPELRWGEGPVAEKRAVIEREVRRIVVLPARGHRAFDPSRVVIMWSVPDDWMLVEEVAQALRIARQTAYDWLRQGRFGAKKVNGHWCVHRDELAAFIEGSRLHPTRR